MDYEDSYFGVPPPTFILPLEPLLEVEEASIERISHVIFNSRSLGGFGV